MELLKLKNPFGAPIYYEETVSSTFDIARSLSKQNEPHGTVICADFQEAGRGRQGRSWIAEKGKNLLFTILLRYGDASSIPVALTLKTGLAVSLALEDFAPPLAGSVKVKWPNDVMIGSRKAAGILTEGEDKTVYIGMGVNVAQREFPGACHSKAVSIIQVFPDLPENANFILLEKILFRLYGEIENLLLLEPGAWRERLLGRLYKKGETVSFASGAADSECLVEGQLSGLGPGGELLIIPRGEKKEQAFVTGELRVY
jgi:BirA family biotin operon repressor/biotin-[acetyl-CoA-carboxylase] ligase